MFSKNELAFANQVEEHSQQPSLADMTRRAIELLQYNAGGYLLVCPCVLGPLVHASGQWSAFGTLLGGGRIVLYDRPHVDMTYVLDLVERERVNALNLVEPVQNSRW